MIASGVSSAAMIADADRDAQRQRVAVVTEFAAGDAVDQPRRRSRARSLVGMLEQDPELVAADPRDASRSCGPR